MELGTVGADLHAARRREGEFGVAAAEDSAVDVDVVLVEFLRHLAEAVRRRKDDAAVGDFRAAGVGVAGVRQVDHAFRRHLHLGRTRRGVRHRRRLEAGVRCLIVRQESAAEEIFVLHRGEEVARVLY